jgi:hypothetical protein
MQKTEYVIFGQNVINGQIFLKIQTINVYAS